MKVLENKYLWRGLTLVYLLALCYLCFSTPDSLPSVENWKFFIPADKLVHFLMFFPAPVLLYLSLGKRWKTVRKALPTVGLCFLICCVLAGTTEIIQNFRPGRSRRQLRIIPSVSAIQYPKDMLLPGRKF